MKKETREVFVARDGSVFVTQSECVKHEMDFARNTLSELILKSFSYGDDGHLEIDDDDLADFIIKRFNDIEKIVKLGE